MEKHKKTRIAPLSQIVRAAAVLASAFLSLTLVATVILLFLPSNMHRALICRTLRILFCSPGFLAVCGICIGFLYLTILLFIKWLFWYINPFDLWHLHILSGLTVIALVLLMLGVGMPSLDYIKGSWVLTTLLGCSAFFIFFTGALGYYFTADIAAADYKNLRWNRTYRSRR